MMIVLALTASPLRAATSDAENVAQRFFGAVRRHDYRVAYNLLSPGVRRDLPFGEFARRSSDIKSFDVLELRAVERGAHLVRYRVKGRLRMAYRGSLYDAIYAGQASISRNGTGWSIAQVDLKPIFQKRIGPLPPEYHV